MRRSRTLRQLIVSVAIATMVFCQGAALAAAGATAPSAGSVTSAQPCHEQGAPAQSGASSDGCTAKCQTMPASPEPSKFDGGAVISLPLLSACTATAANGHCTTRYEPLLHHAASPPPHIVFCRLLN
jgi:hypothetical protein